MTYGTNSEFGFDYLRDNMAGSLEEVVQRGHPFGIVDEVDNILIDEARTPLIISGAPEEAADLYFKFARLAPQLKGVPQREGHAGAASGRVDDRGHAAAGRSPRCLRAAAGAPGRRRGGARRPGPRATIAATLPREDPRDAFVLPAAYPGAVAAGLDALGRAPNIGTSSVRRIAQLSPSFPGATFTPIRGNVDSRLRKLDAAEYDALVLAAAGLRRLGFGDRITAMIPPRQCVPAPGQGIVAVEIRAGDEQCRRALRAVHDAASFAALDAERRVVSALGGGCQLPLGALATISAAEMELQAIVCSPDGRRIVRAQAAGPAADPLALGIASPNSSRGMAPSRFWMRCGRVECRGFAFGGCVASRFEAEGRGFRRKSHASRVLPAEAGSHGFGLKINRCTHLHSSTSSVPVLVIPPC